MGPPMTFFITQCPHCGTSFRTRINQLQSAEGMVRCGACLKVFVADDNLVPSAQLQTMTVVPAAEEEEALPLFGEDAPPVQTALSPQGGREDEDEHDEDDILTLDLADSLPGRITPSISEQPLWEILDEVPPEDAAPESEPGPSLSALHASLEQEAGPDDYRFDTRDLASVGQADDVLELDWQQPPPRGRMLWPYAALLVVILLGQFIYQEFDMLSENANTRPWLQRACNALGCQLPQIVDIGAVHSDNLLVRSHPEYSNALSVSMTVRNDAGYPQPFPTLNLKFSNVRNEAVAVRSFTPAEYLPEGVSEEMPMPANAPVQVSLEILDPGIEAVNYEVSFSPKTPH